MGNIASGVEGGWMLGNQTDAAPLGLKSGGAPRNYRHAAPLGLGVRKGKVMEDRRGWETSPTYSKERSTA